MQTGRSRHAKVVRLRSRSQDQIIRLVCISHTPRHGTSTHIDGYNLRHLDIDVGMTLQESPQVEGRIARRKNSGRDLVEQWLELMVVILIDHRDSEISVGRQTLGACQSSETRTHDYDAL